MDVDRQAWVRKPSRISPKSSPTKEKAAEEPPKSPTKAEGSKKAETKLDPLSKYVLGGEPDLERKVIVKPKKGSPKK